MQLLMLEAFGILLNPPCLTCIIRSLTAISSCGQSVHLGPMLRFVGELGTSVETGRNGGPRPGLDKENLYVHQGFFDIGLLRSGKNSVTLRAGRQEMSFGSRYLISPRDGRNIRRSFTG